MITEKDLHEAIAECQGERNPNANTCIKLAAYFTILNQMYPAERLPLEVSSGYSGDLPEVIYIESESEFAQEVNGREPQTVWPLVDELMQTISVVNPRLYASVMRKLHN